MKPSKLLRDNLSYLLSRRLLTPNYLTALIMLLGLPGKVQLDKRVAEESIQIGGAPLEIRRIDNGKDELQINFLMGNNVHENSEGGPFDNVSNREAKRTRTDRNHILFNYPDIGGSQGTSNHTDELVQIGYELVKKQISDGMRANDITLYGDLFNGNVVAKIARKLHEEDHYVNTTIVQAPGRMSQIVYLPQSHIRQTEGLAPYAPLITSAIATELVAILPGIVISEFINSIGLLIASSIAYTGYMFATLLEMMPFMGGLMAFSLNHFSSWVADGLYNALNGISALIGAAIMVPFILGGLFVAALVGGIMTLLDKDISIEPFLSTVLNLTIGNLDVVEDVEYMLNLERHGNIEILNTEANVIVQEAALETQIGLK